MTVQNLLFCAHTLCMSDVPNTFLLVRSSIRSKQVLCFHYVLCTVKAKKRTKTYNKELCQVSEPFPSINYGLTRKFLQKKKIQSVYLFEVFKSIERIEKQQKNLDNFISIFKLSFFAISSELFSVVTHKPTTLND